MLLVVYSTMTHHATQWITKLKETGSLILLTVDDSSSIIIIEVYSMIEARQKENN